SPRSRGLRRLGAPGGLAGGREFRRGRCPPGPSTDLAAVPGPHPEAARKVLTLTPPIGSDPALSIGGLVPGACRIRTALHSRAAVRTAAAPTAVKPHPSEGRGRRAHRAGRDAVA